MRTPSAATIKSKPAFTPSRQREPVTHARHTVVAIFGGLMGLAGIEHGVGEILQGSQAPRGMLILSWPDAPFFKIMGGEPAFTVIPHMLITGILAVMFSLAYLILAAGFSRYPRRGLLLMLLCPPMFLFGAGLFPPVLGLFVGSIAASQKPAPGWWARLLPASWHHQIARMWPVILVKAVIAWLALMPGMNILSYSFGISSDLLMVAILAAALIMLPLIFFSSFSRDLAQSNAA